MIRTVISIGILLLYSPSILCGQDLTKVANVIRIEQDASGAYRVQVVLDKDHSTSLKFLALPTAEQITEARAKVLAQEAQDKADVAAKAEAAKTTCPTCGQTLPVEGTK